MYPYNTPSQSQAMFQNQLLQSIAPTQPVMSRHVTKVNGRAGAEAFSMPPDSDDILLDLNDPIIYFVQTDGAGYKTITPYDISPHKEVDPKAEYRSLEERITKLEEAFANGKSNYRPNEQRNSKPGSEHNDAGSRSNDKG